MANFDCKTERVTRSPEGPYHGFVLLNYLDWPPHAYLDVVKACSAQRLGRENRFEHLVHLSDEVLACFSDQLSWIETKLPWRSEPYSGLNWYGPTLIEGVRVEQFLAVIGAWRRLLELGPDQLLLKGPVHYEPRKKRRPAKLVFHRLVVDKATIVASLSKIEAMAIRAAAEPQKLYLLHLGI